MGWKMPGILRFMPTLTVVPKERIPPLPDDFFDRCLVIRQPQSHRIASAVYFRGRKPVLSRNGRLGEP